MNYGFFRAASASLNLKVADPQYNKNSIISAIEAAEKEGARLLVTPELSVTGYTCADLFFTFALQNAANDALAQITAATKGKNIAVLLGMPVPFLGSLYNCAVLVRGGKIIGAVPKKHIANYNEFYEKRWFASGFDFEAVQDISICGFDVKIGDQIFDLGGGAMLGVELCEDLWVPAPPSSQLVQSGANIIANLSASDEYVSKAQYRKSLVENQSARCVCGYVYAGAGPCESTTDLVFSGATLIAENGSVAAEGNRFDFENQIVYADLDIEKLSALRRNNMSFSNKIGTVQIVSAPVQNNENDLKHRFVDPHPFVPADDEMRRERCREIFAIQSCGLAKRISHVGSAGAIVGISGGLDSTLALLVAAEAMKRLGKSAADIIGITMPGFGTTGRTYNNALELMRRLGVQIMRDIEHNSEIHDITYENTQARERTQILFDMANKHNMLLVGTGDLSELAMGWCTYNGDHMSMYGVNASVPKTLVRYLVEYVASVSDKETAAVLYDILDTPVSPELLPPDENGNIAQKTEENIGPYELHDFFLYNFVRFGFSKEKLIMLAQKAFEDKYSPAVIEKWASVFMRRFFISQFKRSCIPDSPKVGSVSLSPRGDWRMPSDASFNAFV